MANICGCLLPQPVKEYTISGKVLTPLSLVYLCTPTIHVDLRKEVICDVYNILKNLECGIQPDLEFILSKISQIEIEDEDRTET